MVRTRAEDESFITTNWTMVARAGDRHSPEGKEALAALCSIYWYPLFAYVRRLGQGPAEAEDSTQAFVQALLEKEYLKDADRERGRFRTFLLASIRNHLSNELRDARAQKRGGGKLVSFDLVRAEERFARENPGGNTAEQFFERQWALTLLEQVRTRLREEQVRQGRETIHDALRPLLEGKGETGYRAAGERLGMTEGAVKVAVHRLRRRFGELLREEIGRTVASPEDIADELRNLFAALQG